MWGFDRDAFRLQYKQKLIKADENYMPVNRIKEFDDYTDYYGAVTAPYFGYRQIYSGHNPESGGWVADRVGYLRMGQGNSIDGYILFQVPKEAFDEDVMLLGSFSTFGTAHWKFEE